MYIDTESILYSVPFSDDDDDEVEDMIFIEKNFPVN